MQAYRADTEHKGGPICMPISPHATRRAPFMCFPLPPRSCHLGHWQKPSSLAHNEGKYAWAGKGKGEMENGKCRVQLCVSEKYKYLSYLGCPGGFYIVSSSGSDIAVKFKFYNSMAHVQTRMTLSSWYPSRLCARSSSSFPSSSRPNLALLAHSQRVEKEERTCIN